MADLLNVYIKCPQCNGTGEITQSIPSTPENPNSGTEVVVCPMCDGEKEVYWGRMEETPVD
jgi:DnaJ-class molecular chaperone